MIEVITRMRDGRKIVREVKAEQSLGLYGDEVELVIYPDAPIRRSKRRAKDAVRKEHRRR